MKDTAVVTGCDRSYLPLLRDLLENLRDLGVAAFADVYVFDIGLHGGRAHRGLPDRHGEVARLMTRTAPRQAILSVHLIGATKHDLAYSREDGRKLAMPLRYPAIRALRAAER